MKWLVYMYPKSWRRRYGNELIEVLNQTDKSFKTVIDLLLGIIDAWHIELSERDIYGYRISQALVLITLINVFIILKVNPLKEVILVEQVAMFAVLIAMLSLFLAIVTFIVSLFKFGVKEGFSLKTKLSKTSLGLMGVYAVCITTFLVLIN
ncbi:hypothetical protein KBP50_18195 [Virgibacillus pantothenticus]|uniref:Uncharacterized protein n=2 Tax=Virgibacillus pantothenticus TaxID=1473 RepID=A0A0L0QL49_VIRPA|nr:hypothetical protein AFK71_12310 [Virgibacillus pantothenticus]QTY15772.1 hypothetical protein KBP50_18195 [Virgibacillus pantothenticus]SIS96693.1 hypothetical protein SAMN05421787_10890 [Virgibacillus pantothenticus]